MKNNKSIQFIGRLIIAIIILSITAFFTPGFNISSIWILVSAIAILTCIDFVVGYFTRLYYYSYLKLLIGFVLSAIVLYLIQYIMIGYTLSLVSIVLGAMVYGLVDYMLPNKD